MRALLVCINQRWIVEAASMTHDELIATLNSKQFMDSRTPETPYFALRAVVELHKPQEITLPDGSWGQNCKECDNNWGLCKTIQIIEGEL